MSTLSISMRLTLIRLIFSPLVLPLLLVYLLPYNSLLINSCLATLFALLALTDFFDGYYARKYNQESTLGRVLDPLADKFLTYSALIALLAAGKIYFYWVIVLIGRELFVMGLRHIALEHEFSISVSKLSKLKTAILMICIAMIIVNPFQKMGVNALYWNATEMGLLLVTLVLSLLSAEQYYDDCMKRFRIHMGSPEKMFKEIPHDDSIS